MLLDFKDLIAKHGLKITGVIHVGAHEGQEVELYISEGIKHITLFEPCEIAYTKLSQKWGNHYAIHKVALGKKAETLLMNIETSNGGQSNSLLKPKNHLIYYPQITFNDKEEVAVRLLDEFPVTGNCLVMDVQGWELNVLQGAEKTLNQIDYIYTEVNTEELYEGCAMVTDLDNYLINFNRVETKLTKNGWGDALYVRR